MSVHKEIELLDGDFVTLRTHDGMQVLITPHSGGLQILDVSNQNSKIAVMPKSLSSIIITPLK